MALAHHHAYCSVSPWRSGRSRREARCGGVRQRLGQSVIVENRAGGGGKTGNAAVARAEPDGHTLLVTLSSLAVLPEADRLFARPVAYEVSDLIPVASILADPTLLAVPASSPWKTLRDFVEDAKARPGTYPMVPRAPMARFMWRWRCSPPKLGSSFYTCRSRRGPAMNALLQGCTRRWLRRRGPQAPCRRRRHPCACKLGRGTRSRIPRRADVQGAGLPDVEFYIWAGPLRSEGHAFCGGRTPAARDERRLCRIRRSRKYSSTPAVRLRGSMRRISRNSSMSDSTRLISAVKKIGKVE